MTHSPAHLNQHRWSSVSLESTDFVQLCLSRQSRMLLLVVGLTWCVTSAVASIPPWSSPCSQQVNFPNACGFGNLQVTLFSKTMLPKDCNHQVSVKEFAHTPVIHIDTTNSTETFTVVMVDLGPEGRGPNYLQWMVTNVTARSLPLYNTIPLNNVLASYNPPSLVQNMNHRTLVQILVLRHLNVLRVPFGELWVKQLIRNFSLSTLFSNTYPNLRLCGPVAGTQYWLYDPDRTPSAPPAPPQPGVQLAQPVQPVYIPVVPVVPVGQAPPAPVPAAPAPAPSQHQHAHTTFPKKSSASMSQPMQILFIPLVILAVMWL